MHRYILIDGAMTPYSLAKEVVLGGKGSTCCYPLLAVPDLRMHSAVLIDLEKIEQHGELLPNAVDELINACPSRLHISHLQSNFDLTALGSHLATFAYFHDQDSQLFGLRLADCRVLDTLPHVLTKLQWATLTRPIAKWEIHKRTGALVELPLSDKETQIDLAAQFTLDVDQLDALFHKAQPDALLAHLGFDLNTIASDPHIYWVWAKKCIQLWEQSANTNRAVLNAFAKRVLNTNGKALTERDWVAVLATATEDDMFGNGGLND